MAKYRVLTKEELSGLEKEFVEFLVLNGITADDWEKLKKNDAARANGILDAFSDVVFEKIMRKTHYVEQRSRESWLSFHCQATQIVMIGISSKDGKVDFSLIEDFKELQEKDLEIFTQSKKYKEQRELEIYDMIKHGATISTGDSYKQFAMVLAELNAGNN